MWEVDYEKEFLLVLTSYDPKIRFISRLHDDGELEIIRVVSNQNDGKFEYRVHHLVRHGIITINGQPL